MEDVLDTYCRPYDPLYPVVCLDETNRQLIERRSIPAVPIHREFHNSKSTVLEGCESAVLEGCGSILPTYRESAIPGHCERVDYEYRRCGVVDLFVAFEPLAARRIVKVTQTRTAIDFALFVKELVDVHYSQAEKIVLVMDNLNIHTTASLYKAFVPQEARRIAQRLEIHHTPKHASWLNMAEIEIGVLSRQCLAQPMTDIDTMRRNVLAWQSRRNAACSTVNWRFTAVDARIKLKRLYPVID